MSEVLQAAQRRALDRLRRHGVFLAHAFDLPLRSIDAESPSVRRRLGICFDDGRIRIRLHALRGPPLLKYSVMVDTLCHELAHLRHLNHGQRFWRLYRRILEYARRHGIYRPGPEPNAPRAAAFETLPLEITRALPRDPVRRPAPLGQLELF